MLNYVPDRFTGSCCVAHVNTLEDFLYNSEDHTHGSRIIYLFYKYDTLSHPHHMSLCIEYTGHNVDVGGIEDFKKVMSDI